METSTFSAFQTVLAYSVFILVAPITTYFASKLILFEGLIGATNVTSSVWSAIFAVVVLHLALGLYIYKAHFEADNAKPPQKID